MTPISVIILAHQINSQLEAALESAAWADEVIIVATTISDQWRNVAKKYDAALFQYPHAMEDFAEVRNWALSVASNEWVFFLDSDEVIDAKTLPALAEALTKNANGLFIQRIDFFQGKRLKWGEVHDSQILRILKKGKGQFVRPVHEIAKVQGQSESSGVVIYHHAHESVGTFMSSVVRYAALEAKYRTDQNEQFTWFRLFVNPPAKGIYNYIVKLGFLDGYPGLVYAFMMSLHSLLVSILMYEKNVNRKV